MQALLVYLHKNEDLMAICLEITTPNKKYFVELKQQKITIGRSSKCDLRIAEDDMISSKHLSLTLDNGRVFINDLGSTNGVYLNGSKITQDYLYLGQSLQFGASKMKIVAEKLNSKESALLQAPSSNRHKELTLKEERQVKDPRDIKISQLGKKNYNSAPSPNKEKKDEKSVIIDLDGPDDLPPTPNSTTETEEDEDLSFSRIIEREPSSGNTDMIEIEDTGLKRSRKKIR